MTPPERDIDDDEPTPEEIEEVKAQRWLDEVKNGDRDALGRWIER